MPLMWALALGFSIVGTRRNMLNGVTPNQSGAHGVFRRWSAPATPVNLPSKPKPDDATSAEMQADLKDRAIAVCNANGQWLVTSSLCQTARAPTCRISRPEMAALLLPISTRAKAGGLSAPKKAVRDKLLLGPTGT